MEIRNQNSTISYKGLTKQLSRDIFSKDSITALDKLNPKSKGIAGNLPSQWVKNMPIENRAENIKNLYEALGDFVSHVLIPSQKDEKAGEILTDILKEHNAIQKDAKVTITSLESGYFGQGYKIENTSDNSTLFLKQFYKSNSSRDREYPRHGIASETNANIYVQHNFKKNSEKKYFPKFFYGDIRHNYYIEDFIDPNQTVDYRTIPFSKRHCLLKDVRHTFQNKNMVHSDVFERNVVYYYDKNNNLQIKCFDMGGVEKLPDDWNTMN